MGCHALLQGIFRTQGLNQYLLFSALAGRLFTWGAQINTTSHPGDAPGSNKRSHTYKACALPLSYIRPQAEAGAKDCVENSQDGAYRSNSHLVSRSELTLLFLYVAHSFHLQTLLPLDCKCRKSTSEQVSPLLPHSPVLVLEIKQTFLSTTLTLHCFEQQAARLPTFSNSSSAQCECSHDIWLPPVFWVEPWQRMAAVMSQDGCGEPAACD